MEIKKILYTALITLAVIFMPAESKANDPHQVGEILEYEVSFLGMKIGSIKTYMKGDRSVGGVTTHYVKAEIKSEPGIPYVNLDVVFDSWMDQSFAYSHKFIFGSTTDGEKTEEMARFDYGKDKLNYEMKVDGKTIKENTREINRKVNDGCSLLFMARKYVDRNKTVKVPTYIDDENSLTIINFHNRVEEVEIDAVDYPIRTKYLDGTAKWKGLYGLSGEFEGWFSDDDASVPIRAKMNVYIGTVDMKLVKWSRTGWTPPKAS